MKGMRLEIFLKKASWTIPNSLLAQKSEKEKQDLGKERQSWDLFPSLPVWQDTVVSQRLLHFSIFFLSFELPILPKGNTHPSAAPEEHSS